MGYLEHLHETDLKYIETKNSFSLIHGFYLSNLFDVYKKTVIELHCWCIFLRAYRQKDVIFRNQCHNLTLAISIVRIRLPVTIHPSFLVKPLRIEFKEDILWKVLDFYSVFKLPFQYS